MSSNSSSQKTLNEKIKDDSYKLHVTFINPDL